MMTSLHSYVGFVFVGVSPQKDEEDCANHLIGIQSMMLAGVLAGDAREPPGRHQGGTREPSGSHQGLLHSKLCMQPGAMSTLGREVGMSVSKPHSIDHPLPRSSSVI